MVRVSKESSQGWHRAIAPTPGQPRVGAADLERAWRATHREGAPALARSQRMLMLSALFSGQTTEWLAALEARLEALEGLSARHGKPPDATAFEAAARGALSRHGAAFLLPSDTVW